MTQDNREKFIYLAKQYNQLIKFYNVEELCADKLAEMIRLIPSAKTSQLSVAALYRLLIPQLLPADIEKCIYLDSDIIVNLDINELWQIELGDKIFAAIPDNGVNSQEIAYLSREGYVDNADHFNSGVLLMNLKILRGEENHILEGIKFVGEHPQFVFLDQDILNYLYSKNYLKLSKKFNLLVYKIRRLSQSIITKKIYHFAGGSVGIGLGLEMNDSFNRLWLKYFVKTPWFNEKTIVRFYSCFQNLQQLTINLSATMSGKTRAFILFEKDLNMLVKTFSVRRDEEILLVREGFPVNKMIDIMNASRNEKIFFIMLPDFPFEWLTKSGFVEGKDFFNVYDFLSESQGVSLSYQLLKSM